MQAELVRETQEVRVVVRLCGGRSVKKIYIRRMTSTLVHSRTSMDKCRCAGPHMAIKIDYLSVVHLVPMEVHYIRR